MGLKDQITRTMTDYAIELSKLYGEENARIEINVGVSSRRCSIKIHTMKKDLKGRVVTITENIS